MRKIAMKSGTKRTDLGYMLDLEATEIDQILCKYSDPTDQAFRMLLVNSCCFIISELTQTCLLHNILQLLQQFLTLLGVF